MSSTQQSISKFLTSSYEKKKYLQLFLDVKKLQIKNTVFPDVIFLNSNVCGEFHLPEFSLDHDFRRENVISGSGGGVSGSGCCVQ